MTTSAPEPTSLTEKLISEPSKTTKITTAFESTTQTETETSEPAKTTSPESTDLTDTVTFETGETTLAVDHTSPINKVTSESVGTTFVSAPTSQTDLVTSHPAGPTLVSEPTGPVKTTSAIDITSLTNTVTSESARTTSSAEATTTTGPQSTQSSGPPSSPPTEPPTGTSTVTPTDQPLTTIPTAQPSIPSTKPPTDPPTTTPSATPTTQTTPQPVTTADPLKCQNGGYFNGFNCTCSAGFSGKLCEFVESVDPVTFNRSVAVNVVINQEFNDKYEDKTSSEYIEFVGNFTDQMEAYYRGKDIKNFKGVVVTSVSRGGPLVRLSDNTAEQMRLSDEAMSIYSITPRTEGVSVAHDVVLGIPNNASSEQLYESDFKAVKEAVVELLGCTADCPYNITAEPTVTATETDFGSVCERFVDNEDVVEYYEPVTAGGTITCATVCNSLHPHPKKCYHKGICRVYRNTGPLCHCQNVDSTWYLGNDCSFPIQRTAFYVGLSLTLAWLLVTVGALTAYLLINKHKETMGRDLKEQQVNQWLTEDFEWSRSNRSNDTYNAGDYRNHSFTHEESAVHREEQGVYRLPAPVYHLTGPSLDTDSRQSSPSASIYPPSQMAQTHNNPFSNAGFSQPSSLPHKDFSSNLMQINRPQIKTSWDA
ncbi:uncharacterized protein LOC144459816 [Epinephelus lanceolatus]